MNALTRLSRQPIRFLAFGLLCVILTVLTLPTALDAKTPSDIQSIALSELPKEAKATIKLIKEGGPFPYDRDGIAFGNREKVLPKAKRGYYREYTVKTPGAKNRGARRIVTGDKGEIFYSDDHYQTFKQVIE